MKAIFYILIGGMALAFTGIGIYCLYDTIQLQFYGKQTIGSVVGYNMSFTNVNPFTESGNSDYITNGNYSSDLFYTQVVFKTETGKIVYYTSNGGSDSPEYNEGEQLLIYYNPENPVNAKIGNEGWLMPAIFIPVGLLLIFATWKLGKLSG